MGSLPSPEPSLGSLPLVVYPPPPPKYAGVVVVVVVVVVGAGDPTASEGDLMISEINAVALERYAAPLGEPVGHEPLGTAAF